MFEPKPDGLIFDLDGTLWDTVPAVVRAWNMALKELGHTHIKLTYDDIMGLMGLSHDDLLDNFLLELSRSEREEALRVGYKIEELCLRQEGGKIYSGVEAGLKELSENYPLFIVSNCQVGYLDAFFQFSGLQPLFKDWTCFGATTKPKEENIKMLVDKFSLNTPVYIGDTKKDFDAADKAGVRFLYAKYGFGDVKQAVHIAKNFSEVKEVFLA